MPVWRGEGDFLTLLKADKDVAKALSAAELEALFDLGYHLKHVDTIFERVFGELEAVRRLIRRVRVASAEEPRGMTAPSPATRERVRREGKSALRTASPAARS